MSIETIVGPKAFARLKKEGLSTGKEINAFARDYGSKALTDKLMSVAGIGPAKVANIFTFLGTTMSKAKINARYNALPTRTRWQKVKGTYQRLADDPKKTIGGLESARKQLVDFQNLVSSVYNVGRDAKDKREIIRYAPVSSTLDPFAIDYKVNPKDLIYGEVFITPTETGGEIFYSITDSTNDAKILTEREYFSKGSSIEVATAIVNILKYMYKRFRERSKTALMFIILEKSFDPYFNSIRDAFITEIEAGELFIVPNPEEYYSWEALFKYRDNPKFIELTSRLHEFYAYFLYDRYLSTGGQMLFSDWKPQAEVLENNKFWTVIEQYVTGRERSYITLTHPNEEDYFLHFGVLRGMPEAYGFKKKWRLLDVTLPVARDTGYESYQGFKREFPFNLQGVNIPMVVIALVHSVLDDFNVWMSNDASKVLFESKELSGIGFMMDRRVKR